MDDVEKTQNLAGGTSHDLDPEKTQVVPNAPRPGETAKASHDQGAEKTQIVRDMPVPPARTSPTAQDLYPPAGPRPQRSPIGPPAQSPQRPATPPPAQHGPPQPAPPIQYGPPAPQPAPPIQYGPPAPQPAPPIQYGPPPMSGPANYGPPPATAPGHRPGPQQPRGYAPQPNPSGPPQPQPGRGQPPPQSPLDAANAALAKGGSFITRLIHRGMYGELIKNPWFQQTRQQSPDQFIYIGFGIGAVLALILGQIGGGLIGDILTLAIWTGLAYTFFAIGTKKAVQFVAYGICTVGPALYLWGAIFGFLTWSELASSPYASLGGSSIGIIILLQSISSTVFAALLIWAGITVHRTIKKLSGQG